MKKARSKRIRTSLAQVQDRQRMRRTCDSTEGAETIGGIGITFCLQSRVYYVLSLFSYEQILYSLMNKYFIIRKENPIRSNSNHVQIFSVTQTPGLSLGHLSQTPVVHPAGPTWDCLHHGEAAWPQPQLPAQGHPKFSHDLLSSRQSSKRLAF